MAELARTGRPRPETEPDRRVEAELGDLLFTIVNLARFVNVDPELALRTTTQRFVVVVAEIAPRAPTDVSAAANVQLQRETRFVFVFTEHANRSAVMSGYSPSQKVSPQIWSKPSTRRCFVSDHATPSSVPASHAQSPSSA